MADIYRGKRMRVEKTTFTLPSGRSIERIVVRPGNAVAMLPIEGEYCYLLRQYRYPIDRTIYEVPAGTMDGGETPAETAARELIEEAQLRADTLVPRGYIYTTPGFTDEVIHLFEARDLSPSTEYLPDEDELIEVVKVRTDELHAMIRDGRIVDAKTICLLCRCLP
jgi:ADP-ribose pyrophosphatase